MFIEYFYRNYSINIENFFLTTLLLNKIKS